jgi:predicted PurR-regulated permease PerM
VALASRNLIPETASRAGAHPILLAAIVVAFLFWARIFLVTFVAAMAIAFILEPFVTLLMRLKLPRPLASFFVCSLGLGVVYLMGLGAYSQLASLSDEYQEQYQTRVSALVENVVTQLEGMERATYQILVPARQRQQQKEQQQQLQQSEAARKRNPRRRAVDPTPPPEAPPAAVQEVRIASDRTPLSEYLFSRLGSLYQALLMASFVPFLVYFMLSWRDHIYRSFLQFFAGEDRAIAAKSLQGIAGMVRAFVVGNFTLGLLLAMASSIAFWKMGLPYPMLVGPISGFFSLVPYIGLPLAIVPPLLVNLMVTPALSAVLLVTLVVTLFHVVALNLLYPKLVGSRVHLNPLAVTVALMFWGFLWDAAGLVLAIPLTAGIKAVCDNVKSLRSYGKLLGD